jgi:hypothetical protein
MAMVDIGTGVMIMSVFGLILVCMAAWQVGEWICKP